MAGHKNRKEKKARNIGKRPLAPMLGYYLIVTDTQATERAYFEGLRESLPQEIQRLRSLVIHVEDTGTVNLVSKCKELFEYDPQYRIPWIVFDRDQVPDFDDIVADAEKEGINAGWSNPCLEIWLFAYFGRMPSINTSWQCCSSFGDLYKQKTGQEYHKSDRKLYKKLLAYGNERNAIKIAEQKYKEQMADHLKEKPSDMISCTTVFRLVKEIRSKTDNAEN